MDILITYDIKENRDALKNALVQIGFNDFSIVNNKKVKLPESTLITSKYLTLKESIDAFNEVLKMLNDTSYKQKTPLKLTKLTAVIFSDVVSFEFPD